MFAPSSASTYPYTGAKIDGLPGTQVGGVIVPDPNDADHQYQDPPAGAFRGPCPGKYMAIRLEADVIANLRLNIQD